MLTMHRAASCSVPLVFSAASLLAKDPKTGEGVPWNPSPQRWIDGSVDNDLPMTRLAELFNVNHFIVSQVNPHVVPFLAREDIPPSRITHRSHKIIASGPKWLRTIADLAKGEALHRMHTLAEIGIFPNALTKAVSVLSQKYSGDITILPEISYTDFPRMLSNPTADFTRQAQLSGERATWPKLSRIKNHCAIELALDNAVHKLRTMIAFSSSQVDLRIGAHVRPLSDNRSWRRGKAQDRQSKAFAARVATSKSTNHHRSHGERLSRPAARKHRKARSINTMFQDPLNRPISLQPPQSTSLRPASLKLPILPHEFPSGAETSTLTTSASSSSISSPSASEPSSPSSPISPPFGTNKDLFPSTSQPVTPAVR